MTALIPLTNTPRDYAWGAIDGVARALGWAPSGGPEAELWLGAHPVTPSVDADETVLDAADSCPAMAITVTDGGREIGPRP